MAWERVKWFIFILVAIVVVTAGPYADAQNRPDVSKPIELLIRCDDIGMSHAVNQALRQVIQTGLPFSASVMFACPWYQEAVDILKEHPEVSVGVHLTLNAEWKNYKWGPVADRGKVASLVDEAGHFFPSRDQLYANKPKVSHVRRELRAQIERALATGLRLDYVDYHMGTAVSTPAFRAVVEKLARKYGLGISRYFGEVDARGIYNVPYEYKTDSLVVFLQELEPEVVNLLVFHIGQDTPELSALQDLNPHGLPEMSKHRSAELEALCSEEFKAGLEALRIHLITYREFITRMGLDNMRRPADTGY
ncbi:MAG: ChbG/HpnK family deacetylase [Candidatus Neomarinimicrobiota bacterium]